MVDQVVCPIIYVRGFAGGTSGIDSVTDDPFYGFNAGATHVRVDGDGKPQFYQFAGPLVRLMEDEDYRVVVHGGQQAYLESVGTGTQPANSIWIYRFYDTAADTFGAAAVPYDLTIAAKGLLTFTDLVLDKTGAPRVWLVAHSMGGLICRSMIQKVCPDAGRQAGGVVGKLYTYATPHNGIAFAVAGINITVPEIAPLGAEIFNHDVMYRYLTPDSVLQRTPDRPGNWDAHDLAGSFDPAHVFCLIGTNAADYGLVSKAVGPKSDGLVQIDNAYVRRASRSFVHRSHSGVYGEVNSEEGYQNLRRFLFGTRKAIAELVGARLPAPTDADVIDVWQAEVRVSIRGLPVLLSEQTAAHYCPIELGMVAGAHVATQAPPGAGDDAVAPEPGQPGVPGGAVCLASIFLLDPQRALSMQRESLAPGTVSPRCRYFLHLSVLHLQQKHGLFFWHNHLETLPEWEDALIVDVGPSDDDESEHLWVSWQSENPEVTSVPDPITAQPLAPGPGTGGPLTFTIPLPPAGQALLGPAAIRLTVEQLP
jgi:putative serine esterase DUF676